MSAAQRDEQQREAAPPLARASVKIVRREPHPTPSRVAYDEEVRGDNSVMRDQCLEAHRLEGRACVGCLHQLIDAGAGIPVYDHPTPGLENCRSARPTP